MTKWRNVQRLILNEIQRVPIGGKLKTASDIKKEAHCSLQPVRRALEDLERQGLIERRKGGAAVVRSKLPRAVDAREFSFTHSARDRHGRDLKTEVLDIKRRLPHDGDESRFERQAAHSLGLQLNEPFYVLVRRRVLDGVPRVIHHSYLNPAHFPDGFLERHNFTSSSLLSIIEDHGFNILSRRTTLRARMATPGERAQLAFEGGPVLEAEQELEAFWIAKEEVVTVEYLRACYVDWEYVIEHRM